MARRSAVRNWAEFLPIWILIQKLCWLPLPLARLLAWKIGFFAYRLAGRWRRTARENVRLAFPDLGDDERERIVRGSFDNIGRVLLALARLPRLTPDNISDWIEYRGFEHYERALARGRGVLFLTAHLGVWELSSAAHALYGHPMHVMVRPLDNPLLDRLVDRRRTLFGNRTIVKRDSARAVLQALRANEAVGILADQNAAGDDGVFVDFFGVKASATRGVAQLARRTGATVIPGFAVRDGDRYALRFYEPVEMVETGDREADVVENTQRCQAAIERAVREYPEQWLWIHRRWKRRPEGSDNDPARR